VHWARLEASALGSLIAACPAWKKERRKKTHPFNEMFIINCKSHCCNGIFTGVLFTLLQAKNIYQELTLFLCIRNSISLAILSEIFIQIGHFF